MKIPAEVIKDFYATKKKKTFSKDETIVSPSEVTLPPISYIEKGVVEQYTISESGDKVIVNMFKPGAFFPVSSAVNKSFNAYYFGAVGVVEIRQATAYEVEALLVANPEVVYDLLKRLYKGLDGMLSKFTSALSQTARERLLTEITIHGQRFGEKQRDGSILISVTAEQIARQTGLTRETVSRELKRLETQELLTMKRGKITLRSDK